MKVSLLFEWFRQLEEIEKSRKKAEDRFPNTKHHGNASAGPTFKFKLPST